MAWVGTSCSSSVLSSFVASFHRDASGIVRIDDNARLVVFGAATALLKRAGQFELQRVLL
jgi:hypothetical protein